MKNLKSARGFVHQTLVLALAVVAVIGGIGSYIYLHKSSAATLTATTCKQQGGAWLDLRSKGIDHSPCWSNPGAYLVNFGTGMVGDGIDHVPLSGNNAETGNDKSQKFNYPNYIIVVSGKWVVCTDSSCSSTSTPFTHTKSSGYRTSSGGTAYLSGPSSNLCGYQFWLYGKEYPTRTYATPCKYKGIYIDRI